MIISGIKLGIASKKIAPLLEERSFSLTGGAVNSMGVVLDPSSEVYREEFAKFGRELGIAADDLEMITCLPSRSKTEISAGKSCVPADLNWRGGFSSVEVQEFRDRDFDLLISFTSEDKPLNRILIAGSHARLKVGRGSAEEPVEHYDITISVGLGEVDTFIAELKKYLRILNKIE